MGQKDAKTGVVLGGGGVEAGEGNEAAEVEIVAVIVEAKAIAGFGLQDERVPASEESGCTAFIDVGGDAAGAKKVSDLFFRRIGHDRGTVVRNSECRRWG